MARPAPAHEAPNSRAELHARTGEMTDLKHAAEYMYVSVKTIRRMIADGKLPAYRIGTQIRVKLSDIEHLRVPVTGS